MDKTGNNREDCNHPLDDLFRKGLQDHQVEPSVPVWKGINRKLLLGELARFNFKNVPWIGWIAVTSVVIICSVILYLFLYNSGMPGGRVEKAVAADKQTGVQANKSLSTAQKPGTNVKTAAGTIPGTSTVHNYSATSKNHQVYASKSSKIIPAGKEMHDVTPLQETTSTGQAENTGNTALNKASIARTFSDMAPDIDMMEGIGITTVRDFSTLKKSGSSEPMIRHITNPSSPQEQILTARSLTRIPIHFAAGIDVEPDITFYKTNHSYSKASYSGGLNLQFHFGRFYLKTGAGLGYFEDVGQYLSEYKRFDSVGFYDQVVSYTTNDNQVFYNIIQHAVFDSVLHSTTAVAEDHYLYLQVPLLLGFKAFESDHIRFTFQAGPVVSFLMDKYEPLPEPYYPGGRVTRLVRQTPDRINTNWQIWAGFSVEYLFNRNLSVCLEPTYKYGITPVATAGELPENHSQSVGINIGFRYSFGYNYREQ